MLCLRCPTVSHAVWEWSNRSIHVEDLLCLPIWTRCNSQDGVADRLLPEQQSSTPLKFEQPIVRTCCRSQHPVDLSQLLLCRDSIADVAWSTSKNFTLPLVRSSDVATTSCTLRGRGTVLYTIFRVCLHHRPSYSILMVI